MALGTLPSPLTTNWFRGHRRFPPNRETLPRLDLPIHILQGRWDANTPAEDALAIQETFRRLGKDNLAVHIYPDAGHALGFEQYLATGELPPPSPISLSCARGWDDRTGAGERASRLPLFSDSGARRSTRLKGKAPCALLSHLL